MAGEWTAIATRVTEYWRNVDQSAGPDARKYMRRAG